MKNLLSRLPQILNPKLYFRRDPQKYYEDGMYVENNDSFRRAKKFEKTKNQLIEQIGYDYKMDWRTHIAMGFAQFSKKLQGDFVELGCGEGWIANSIILSSKDILEKRNLYLFDKFDGLSVDIESGKNLKLSHPNYPKSRDFFLSRLVSQKNVNVFSGNLPETLASLPSTNIAFLHIDLNAAAPEVASLRKLFPLVTKGGVVLLDDYCGRGREVQFDAMNDLATELGFEIVSLPTGQGIIVKN